MGKKNTHRHGVLELVLQGKVNHRVPDRDCQVVGDFTGPGGRTVPVRAFWDGGRSWRLRFSPGETGAWTWRTRCLAGHDPGLEGAGGAFECVDYRGENPLYQRGPLTLSPGRRSLAHEDGTPFFWLADTAWNGVIRAADRDWREYLSMRVGQRFNVIQFVCGSWRGNALDQAGEPSFHDAGDTISINPRFFQRLDRRVAMINEFGLVAAPVALWSLMKTDPGRKLNEADATRLASYIVSRYDAYQVAWLLGGDGRYRDTGIDRWKRIGQAVFRHGHDRLASMHPNSRIWLGEDFRGEAWYDFIGYQTSHDDAEEDLRWLVEGPPATAWRINPPLPVINLEPNYETAYGHPHKTVFSDYHVRRAAYWSLLVSPTAGVTYGHDAIWNWNAETGPSEGHGDWHGGAVPPWRTGLETPGIRSMTVLRGIFERLDWQTLVPDRAVLAAESRRGEAESFVAAGRTANNAVVIYAPCGGTVHLAPDAAVRGPVHVVDPRTGESARAPGGFENRVDFPDRRDWLAICGPEWPEALR